MIARAITTRCFWPPDRSEGYFSMNCSGGSSPTIESVSATRLRRSARVPSLWIWSGCSTSCWTVIAGFSEACGSWKMICISRRSRAQLALVHLRDLAPLELDAAFRRRDEPEDRPAERRLPAARLADEPQDLAAPQVDRDVVHGAYVPGLATEDPRGKAPADRVVRLQAADRDEDVGLSQASSAIAISSRSSGSCPPSGISSSGPWSQQRTRRSPSSRCSIGSRTAHTPIALGHRG